MKYLEIGLAVFAIMAIFTGMGLQWRHRQQWHCKAPLVEFALNAMFFIFGVLAAAIVVFWAARVSAPATPNLDEMDILGLCFYAVLGIVLGIFLEHRLVRKRRGR